MSTVLRYSGHERYRDPRGRFEARPGELVEFEDAEARRLLAGPDRGMWVQEAQETPQVAAGVSEPTPAPKNAAAPESGPSAGHQTDAHTAGELGVQ